MTEPRIAGYHAQTETTIDLVNNNKVVEEQCLRILDVLNTHPDIDKRWLAIGRTQLEQAWMAINRAILQPLRIP